MKKMYTLLATAMAVLALSGCAGGQSSPAPTSARDSAVAFAECMRENGVDMPDPGPDGLIRVDTGSDVDPTVFERAQTECAPLLGSGPADMTSTFGDQERERLLGLAECIRENGYPDYPDPEFGDGGQVMLGGGGVDPGDPAFQEVAQACEAEVGLPGPGGDR